MLELRPSCEHCNKPRHPTHLRRASAPTGGRALGDLAINQTKKPQPFLVPMARYAGGDEGALRRRWGP